MALFSSGDGGRAHPKRSGSNSLRFGYLAKMELIRTYVRVYIRNDLINAQALYTHSQRLVQVAGGGLLISILASTMLTPGLDLLLVSAHYLWYYHILRVSRRRTYNASPKVVFMGAHFETLGSFCSTL